MWASSPTMLIWYFYHYADSDQSYKWFFHHSKFVFAQAKWTKLSEDEQSISFGVSEFFVQKPCDCEKEPGSAAWLSGGFGDFWRQKSHLT